MSRFYFALGATLGAIFLLVGSIGGASRSQTDNKHDDATPVVMGELSNQERIHGRLFAHYLDVLGGKTIADAMAEAPGSGIDVIIDQGFGRRISKSESSESYLGAMSHDADVVLRGTIVDRSSQITENGAFVFTALKVSALEVFKAGGNVPLAAGSVLTVIRPGGKVRLNGVIVTAIDYNDPPARMNGNEVVLFLKQIPDSDAYSTVRASGVFELDGHSVTPTSNDSLPSSMSRDKRSFLELLRVTCGKS